MRHFIPSVGTQVKLRLYDHYAALWGQLPDTCQKPALWSWFRVLSVRASTDNRGDPWKGTAVLRLLNGMLECEETYTVDLSQIEAPIGWKPEYDIVCASEKQAEKVVAEWFPRGIHVWASHDLSSAGRMAFTPVKEGEEANAPHWQYTGNPVETISAADCPRIFRVLWLEQKVFHLKGTKKEREKVVAEYVAQGFQVTYLPGTREWAAEKDHVVHERA